MVTRCTFRSKFMEDQESVSIEYRNELSNERGKLAAFELEC